jgi:hypothetical protein
VASVRGLVVPRVFVVLVLRTLGVCVRGVCVRVVVVRVVLMRGAHASTIYPRGVPINRWSRMGRVMFP